MRKPSFTGFCILAALSLTLAACTVLTSPEYTADEPADESPTESGPSDPAFEVIVYDSPHFRGRSAAYSLAENERQGLVDFVGWRLNDRISSIRIGYRVGLAVFYHKNFQGRARIYYNSVNLLEQDFNDQISSFIVFDRDIGEPLGVWLGRGSAFENDLNTGRFPEASRFYPLPAEFEREEVKIKFLEDFNDQAEWVFIAGGDSGGRFGRGAVEAILYEHDKFRGNSLVLPPRRASSLIIREQRPRRTPWQRR